MDSLDQNTRSLFAEHHLRCTQQRAAVFDALRGCKTHPTAEELFNLVRPQMESLSLATIYNTLDALCDAGLARKMPTTNGSFRYDADTTAHTHVCFTETAEILDVPSDLGQTLHAHLPAEVLERIEREMGISIESINIEIQARREAKSNLSPGGRMNGTDGG